MINKAEKYVPLDSEGYLLNDLCFERIPDQLISIINALKDGILNHLESGKIHSIYVRGSIARGEIYEPLSDIDLIVLFYKNTSIQQIKNQLNKIIKEIYPEEIKIDIYGINYQKLPLQTQFSIKVNSICIYGINLSLEIQKFKPDKSICFMQQSFIQDVKMAKADLHSLLKMSSNNLCQQQILKINGWIAKRILRVGLEITIPTYGQYSRDLYSCYRTFAKLFPAYANQMFCIFKLYIERCEDINVLLQAINEIDDFLVGKIGSSYQLL